MDNICFVSVAFGKAYIEQQDRLLNSIKIFYPNVNSNPYLTVSDTPKVLFYRGSFPIGSVSFDNSLYGFKPHAIMEARRCGYHKIVWLDPAMIMMGPVEDLFKYEVMAVKDDHKLAQFISDKYLSVNDFTRDELMNKPWHLVGGSLLSFNFHSQKACDIFNSWLADELNGLFGSQQEQASEQLQGHRSDETCLAMAMYKNGISPVSGSDVRYCTAENPMFIKKHFK